MAQIHRDRIRDKLQRVRSAMQYEDIKMGYLGKEDGTDPTEGLEEPYVWVRFSPDSEAVRALGHLVNRTLPNLPVKVGRDMHTGERTVISTAPGEHGSELPYISTFSVPNRNPDLIYEEFDANRFKDLHVEPGTIAFDVLVEPGLYWWHGAAISFEGGTVNIGGDQPAGTVYSAKKVGVLVGIDPATNTLTTFAGDEQGILETPGNGGKYFTATYIAETLNTASASIYWIALIPLTSTDTNWQSLYRVTALTLMGGSAAQASAGTVRVTEDDTTADYLYNTLTAGNGITLAVVNPGADEDLSITVNQSQLSLANLGGRAFTMLSDVPSSYSGQALKGVRVNAAATALEFYTASGVYALDDLSDVTITAATTDDALYYNGSAWVNGHHFVLLAGDTMTGSLTVAGNTLWAVWGANTYAPVGSYALYVNGVLGTIQADQSGGNFTGTVGARGVDGRAQVIGTAGTVSGAAGVYGLVEKSGAGTLTNGAALWADTVTRSAGTLTRAIGLYLASQVNGTSNYGIFQVGFGLNSFTDGVLIAPTATSGAPNTALTITGAAHTALTASTEYTDLNVNLARTVQFATGTLTTQRAVRIQAPTYSAVGSSTITTAVTVDISGSPVPGTNVTITNPIAVRVGGRTQVNDTVDINPPVVTTGSPLAGLSLTAAAHTTLAATVEYTDVNLNLARTIQFSTGAITTQRSVRVQAPTLSAVGSSTITTAVTFDVSGSPAPGTNVTITNAIAARFGGRTQINGTLDIVPPASTVVPQKGILFTAPAHTALTAQEYIDVHLNLNRNVQFTTGGTISTQRAIVIDRPTYTATSATQTITDAYTMVLVGPPVASTNVSITNARTLWVQAGVTRLDGQVQINELVVMGDTRNFQFSGTTGTKIGTGSSQKIALWDKTPIVRPSAPTSALTTITFTAPGTPDYAIADFSAGGFGFSTADEARTVMSVIANLQSRLNSVITDLTSFGFYP